MKRIISFVLALTMALSMAACGSGEGSGGVSQPTPAPTPTPKTLSNTLAISQYDETSTIISNNYTGLDFTLGDMWTIIDRDKVCQLYMGNVTSQQLEAMGTEELKQLPVIADFAVSNSNANIVLLVTIVNYRASGMEFDEYLSGFKASNTKDAYTISEEKTVVLSGIEYTNFVAYFENSTVLDMCYLDRGDGNMVVVSSQIKNSVVPSYIHAFFNGGPVSNVDTDNVPGLFEYDDTKCRLNNPDSCIEIDLSDGWGAYSKKQLAEIAYLTTEERLNNKTVEEFAQMPEIYDMFLASNNSEMSLSVSYVNRKNSTAYGMTAEELRQMYNDQTNTLISYSNIVYNLPLSGNEYIGVKRYYYKQDITYLYLFRELNEDYIAKITILSPGDAYAYGLRNMFNGNNDIDMLIKRSDYNPEKYQYYNKYSDVRVNVMKDWKCIDDLMISTLYNDTLTVEQLENWTDEQYMEHTIIPDFAVASEDGTTFLMVYYANLNYMADIPNIYAYYDRVVADFESANWVATEKDIGYILGNIEYMMFDSVRDNERTQIAIGDISEDYVVVMVYMSPVDSGLPDILGMIVN